MRSNKKKTLEEPTFHELWRQSKTFPSDEPKNTGLRETGLSYLRSGTALLPHSIQTSLPSFGKRSYYGVDTAGSSSGTSQSYIPSFRGIVDRAKETTAYLTGSSSVPSCDDRRENAVNTTSLGTDQYSAPMSFEERQDKAMKTTSSKKGPSSGTGAVKPKLLNKL